MVGRSAQFGLIAAEANGPGFEGDADFEVSCPARSKAGFGRIIRDVEGHLHSSAWKRVRTGKRFD